MGHRGIVGYRRDLCDIGGTCGIYEEHVDYREGGLLGNMSDLLDMGRRALWGAKKDLLDHLSIIRTCRTYTMNEINVHWMGWLDRCRMWKIERNEGGFVYSSCGRHGEWWGRGVVSVRSGKCTVSWGFLL